MKYQSNAKWQHGVVYTSDGSNVTTDLHDTYEQALGVCHALENYGFGGDGYDFPIETWVSEADNVSS